MPHIENRLDCNLYPFVLKTITDNLGSSFKDTYLRKHIASKYADPKPSLQAARKKAAVDKWLKTEERNSRTNQRLYLDDDEVVVAGVRTKVILDRASRIIRRMIGSTPDMSTLMGSFSGGASTSTRRSPLGIVLKFTQRPDVTQDAWDHIWPWLYRDHDLWHLTNPLVLQPRFVPGNIMFTVPKNDTIDRVACKEPDLNMFMQKAIGDHLRFQLKRVGIDLNDQSINRELARKGSIDGSLATVDLSSASDSISTQLVIRLLPFDWFSLLDSVRCKFTQLPDGTLHENEMFSSMGNAFTFELESLIFYALTKAVLDIKKIPGTVSVYGDDIIIPVEGFKILRSLFGYVGFVINTEKSFYKGFTRESCGGHYHRGVDVTPFYLKRPITTVTELIRVLNRLRNWTSSDGKWCSASWWEVWCAIADQMPYRKLFGGHDLASISTVASLYGDRHRIMNVTRPGRFSSRKPSSAVRSPSPAQEMMEVGLYLQWQNTTIQKERIKQLSLLEDDLDASASDVVFETSRWIIRPLRKRFAYSFGLEPPVFPQEVIE